MSTIIDCPAALVALPRERALVDGARLHADDAQPRPENRSWMPTAHVAWLPTTGSTMRGFEPAARGTQDGRTAVAGGTYATSKQHFSIRSGPSTSRPPA